MVSRMFMSQGTWSIIEAQIEAALSLVEVSTISVLSDCGQR